MSETLSLVTMFVPLFFIVWVANVAENRRSKGQPYEGVAWVAYICVIVLWIGVHCRRVASDCGTDHGN